MKRQALTVALAAVSAVGLAFAAGPYDGTWKGGSPRGGTSGAYSCPPTNATVTVANGKMTGSYNSLQYTFTISATVNPDGSVTGRWAVNPFTGQFSGNHFEGKYSSKECGADRKVTLDKTG